MDHGFVTRHDGRLRALVACVTVTAIAAGGVAAPLAAPSPVSADPTTHYVAAGESIQAAVDAAGPGDTVEVAAGTYNENIVIDKALTLRSADGADVTVIDGGSGSSQIAILVTGSASEVTNVTNVTVEGFTVKTGESYDYDERGIVLYYANDCLIRNNRAMNNWRGISLEGNTWDNIISDNYMTGNRLGVSLQYAGADTVRRNTVVNGLNGIGFGYTSGSTCYRNTIEVDSIGISIFYGSSNYITENVITGAGLWGVSIGPSGCSSQYTTGNTISGCNIGFYSESVGQFVYHNNFLNNTSQVHLPYPNGSVYWDDFVGQGNYWSNYTTRYPEAAEV
jgi:parallel beta-helix repeat protein